MILHFSIVFINFTQIFLSFLCIFVSLCLYLSVLHICILQLIRKYFPTFDQNPISAKTKQVRGVAFSSTPLTRVFSLFKHLDCHFIGYKLIPEPYHHIVLLCGKMRLVRGTASRVSRRTGRLRITFRRLPRNNRRFPQTG